MSDAPQIFDSYAQDEDVCRYMTWLPYEDLNAYEGWLSEKIDNIGKAAQTYVICHGEERSRVIGMLDATIKGHRAEIGYALAKEEWGKGYMTEAVSWFLEALLAQPNIYRVSAVCDLENLGSARVMEKSGMTYEGILRRYIIHPCISKEPRDVKSYSKTQSEHNAQHITDARPGSQISLYDHRSSTHSRSVVDLSRIIAWYSSHCDGDWEHQQGVSIQTLDNPGWLLKVNLIGTNLEDATMVPILEDCDDSSGPESDVWIDCQIREREFIGASDPTQLPRLISIFNILIDSHVR